MWNYSGEETTDFCEAYFYLGTYDEIEDLWYDNIGRMCRWENINSRSNTVSLYYHKENGVLTEINTTLLTVISQIGNVSELLK